MSMLTEQEYEEYIRLLRAWVDAEKACLPVGKALAGPTEADAPERAREAHAAVQSFRERYGLDGHERALERSTREAG